MAWVLMGTHKGALCAAAAPAGDAGGTDLRRRVRIVPGAVHRRSSPYTPAPAPPGCCPGPRAPPSPGALGLLALEGRFIAAGSAHPRSRRPGPAPPPGPTARPGSSWAQREGGRSLGARERRKRGPWGEGWGGEEGRRESGGAGGRARGRSRADPAGSESPRRRQLRPCGRGSDSASCPAPTFHSPPPSER